VLSSDGGLAIAVGPEEVVAVATTTGDRAWSAERTYGPSSPPALAQTDDGDVVVFTEGSGDADSAIQAVNATDGSNAWPNAAPLEAVSRTGVTVQGNTAFVGDDRGNISAFDVGSGDPLWTVRLAGRTLAPLTATSGVVVATVAGGSPEAPIVTALDASSGRRLWEAEPDVFAAGATSGVIEGGRYAVGLPDRSVHSFDLSDGSEVWTSRSFFSLPSPFGAGAAVGGDVVFVYFGDLAGDVRRLDGRTGQLVWDHPLNTPVLRSAPVVSGSTIVVGLRDGGLAAIDAATGDQLARLDAGPGLLGPIAVSPSRLVAVRGGLQAGLVAFEHDAGATLSRTPSPSVLDPIGLASRFALAVLIVVLVLFVPSRLLLSRQGPAFDALDSGEALDVDERNDPVEAPPSRGGRIGDDRS
jgi:outer membrane protein assembly factor BamB